MVSNLSKILTHCVPRKRKLFILALNIQQLSLSLSLSLSIYLSLSLSQKEFSDNGGCNQNQSLGAAQNSIAEKAQGQRQGQ